MEDTWRYSNSILAFLILALAFKLLLLQRRTRWRKLPPSPSPPLPIIGHLHLLKQPLHRTLHSLYERCGPIFSLQLGNRLVVVVSSLSAASECFGKNDVVFANRPRFASRKCLSYNYTSITFVPYGDHWRNLRRFTTLEVFSTTRLNAFLGIRKDEIKLLMCELYGNTTTASRSDGFAKVELKSLFSKLSFNIIMRMVAGKRCCEEGADFEEAQKFRKIVREIAQTGGVSNPSDFLPILGWIDYHGAKKQAACISRKADAFVQGLIDEHRSNESGLESRNTMIDHLLSLQQSEPQYYTDEIIKGLVLVMLLAGTDTSSLTIEWGMTLLLYHPEVLKKVQVELDAHVGQDRFIDESDISKLTYLQCIVLETLRLYPAAPLLLPHMSSDDCIVGGYDIPRGTILLVNAWSIHRDPKLWDDPTSFKPERFEEGGGEGGNGNNGNGPKLMAFGLGRRSCPGAGLAHRVVGLTLASLIQCFEWERISEMPIDLTEGKGTTMPKSVPLEAMCKARLIMSEVYGKH